MSEFTNVWGIPQQQLEAYALQPRIIGVLGGVLWASTLQAQEATTNQTLNTYRFKISVPVQECEYDGTLVGTPPLQPAPPEAQFFYIQQVTAQEPPRAVVVTQFLSWNRSSHLRRTTNSSSSAQP